MGDPTCKGMARHAPTKLSRIVRLISLYSTKMGMDGIRHAMDFAKGRRAGNCPWEIVPVYYSHGQRVVP